MDEILIDEKKYVSSKQAAKMTGYAKDYIGQLCREGRVPARLVGRSWYVLETAIQDHRFGATDVQPNESAQAISAVPEPSGTWESPRYETLSEELLPTINRLSSHPVETVKEESEVHAPENLQDSWRSWFDHVGHTIVPTAPQVTEFQPEEYHQEPIPEAHEDNEVNIPIHTIYQAPPEELLPRHVPVDLIEQNVQEEEPIQRERKGSSLPIRTIQSIGIVVAIVFAGLAVVGSGYLDAYVASNSQVGIISGIQVYNK
jgi:hypothetical protein